jgi:hypothetical protein
MNKKESAPYFGEANPVQASVGWNYSYKAGSIGYMLNLPEQFNSVSIF